MDSCLIDTWKRISCPPHGSAQQCAKGHIQTARAWIHSHHRRSLLSLLSTGVQPESMKIRGASGWGTWSTSMIRSLPEVAMQELTLLLNACEVACQLPVGLTAPLVTMIPKKTAPLTSDFRPIAVLSFIMRWYSRARMIPIREVLEQRLAPQQYGARPARDASVPVARIQCRRQQARDGGPQLYGAQIDLAKYFDNVKYVRHAASWH